MACNIKATLLEPCIISVDESCESKCIGKYSTVYSIQVQCSNLSDTLYRISIQTYFLYPSVQTFYIGLFNSIVDKVYKCNTRTYSSLYIRYYFYIYVIILFMICKKHLKKKKEFQHKKDFQYLQTLNILLFIACFNISGEVQQILRSNTFSKPMKVQLIWL